MKKLHIFRLLLVTFSTFAVLSAVGCGNDAQAPLVSSPNTSLAPASSSLNLDKGWVKASKEGMTALFGVLKNSGDKALTVRSAQTADAGMTQFHETVQGNDGNATMQEKHEGFLIPANGQHELVPGGDHIMLMKLQHPLNPGDMVTLTLSMDDGSTSEVQAQVKDFTGAEEHYAG